MTLPQTMFRVSTGNGLLGEIVAETLAEHLWMYGVQGIEEVRLDDGSICLHSSFGLAREQTLDRLQAVVAHVEELDFSISESRPRIAWQIFDVDPMISETWRDHVSEFEATARITVVPSWRLSEQPTDSDPSQMKLRIFIDPGPTFGMGDHPSTRGALCMIERFVQHGCTVLDVGCGSGILGIASLKLGASLASGLDINPACVEVSTANAVRNDVGERWSVSTGSLDDVSGPHDVIAANILAPVLIDFAPSFRRLLSPRGTLVISGVLDGAFDRVVQALAPLHVVETIVIDNWATLALTF